MKQVTPTAYGETPVPNDRAYWDRRALAYRNRLQAADVLLVTAAWLREQSYRCADLVALCTESSEG